MEGKEIYRQAILFAGAGLLVAACNGAPNPIPTATHTPIEINTATPTGTPTPEPLPTLVPVLPTPTHPEAEQDYIDQLVQQWAGVNVFFAGTNPNLQAAYQFDNGNGMGWIETSAEGALSVLQNDGKVRIMTWGQKVLVVHPDGQHEFLANQLQPHDGQVDVQPLTWDEKGHLIYQRQEILALIVAPTEGEALQQAEQISASQ